MCTSCGRRATGSAQAIHAMPTNNNNNNNSGNNNNNSSSRDTVIAANLGACHRVDEHRQHGPDALEEPAAVDDEGLVQHLRVALAVHHLEQLEQLDGDGTWRAHAC